MPAWWREEGWKMAYTGDDGMKAEHTADKLRKEGKETKVRRNVVKSLAGKDYMEYVTLYRTDE